MVPSIARADKVCAYEALTGRKIDMHKDLKFSFLDYVEAPRVQTGTSNSATVSRTISGLAVWSFGNINGDYKFFNPNTCRHFTRSVFSPVLPYTEGLITHLNSLAKKDGMHDIKKFHITYQVITLVQLTTNLIIFWNL